MRMQMFIHSTSGKPLTYRAHLNTRISSYRSELKRDVRTNFVRVMSGENSYVLPEQTRLCQKVRKEKKIDTIGDHVVATAKGLFEKQTKESISSFSYSYRDGVCFLSNQDFQKVVALTIGTAKNLDSFDTSWVKPVLYLRQLVLIDVLLHDIITDTKRQGIIKAINPSVKPIDEQCSIFEAAYRDKLKNISVDNQDFKFDIVDYNKEDNKNE